MRWFPTGISTTRYRGNFNLLCRSQWLLQLHNGAGSGQCCSKLQQEEECCMDQQGNLLVSISVSYLLQICSALSKVHCWLLRSVLLLKLNCCSEKVTVPATKPNITFQGQGFDLTAISWNDTANSSHGTFYSGSVSVFATGFVAKNISFIVNTEYTAISA